MRKQMQTTTDKVATNRLPDIETLKRAY